MPRIEQYREAYGYEEDCTEKMLAMIESVPETGRGDAKFQQAVSIAGHLADCREFWLAHMTGKDIWKDAQSADGGIEKSDVAALRLRFAPIHAQWTDYLASLDGNRLAQEFEFSDNGECFRLPIGVQIVQLFGHASYHRGQIALLVNQLGGETVDTDYADWWWTNRQGTAADS